MQKYYSAPTAGLPNFALASVLHEYSGNFSMSSLSRNKNNMLSLYVHIPFCVGKCFYCGFYSTLYSPKKADEFLDALYLEVEQCQKQFTGRRIGTVFIGGGTPTVLSDEQLSRLTALLREKFHLDDAVELTVEANPNSVTGIGLAFLFQQGVNRLSLGIQSFSDQTLRTLGRPHCVRQGNEAFMLARATGFRNVGIDLIFGIPGQSVMEWERTIDAAAVLHPEHISAYSLSLDEGSQFARQAQQDKLVLPDDDTAAEMYEVAVRKLHQAGYHRYEISNFSLPGFACRHNQNYWNRGEYLGIGPGSASFVGGKRYGNVADFDEYVRRLAVGRSAISHEEMVGADSAAREFLLLGLRTAQGVDLHRLQKEYGTVFFEQMEESMRALETAGLLFLENGYLRLTDRGFLLSDEVLARLSA